MSSSTSIAFPTASSTLCAAAPTSNFAMFLVERALQGIGCAGLSTAAAAEAERELQFNTFTLFPNLPLELRRKVWKMTFDTTHHVHLHCRRFYRHKIASSYHGPWERPGSLPTALHVCHESRVEALMHHQIVLHDQYNTTAGTQKRGDVYFWNTDMETRFVPKTFWYNSGRDSTYINVAGWVCRKADCECLEIRLWSRSAVSDVQWFTKRNTTRFMSEVMNSRGLPFRNLLLHFKSLENLCFTTWVPTDQVRNATFLKEVRGWLESQKNQFFDGKPPVVCLVEGKTGDGGEAGMPRKPP
ncbi:hypothetical protein DL98DRAFT_629792 [Cadophora sp. DSE1049]|nr:hypothetical protein DL98DRAFT_629792 [Cadophora sp. DSE1049]